MNTLQEKLFQFLEDELIINKKDMFKYQALKRLSTEKLLDVLNKELYTKYIIENNT